MRVGPDGLNAGAIAERLGAGDPRRGFPDPSSAAGPDAEKAAFTAYYVHRMIERRLSIFTSLPLAPLDRMTLTRRAPDHRITG